MGKLVVRPPPRAEGEALLGLSEQAARDLRELLETFDDEELQAWAVRTILPLIDPAYVPLSEEEARRVRAHGQAERERVSA